MSDKKEIKLHTNRKSHNDDIIRRFKAGDPLMGKSAETWFPPRPAIKKDFAAMAKLYNGEHDWDDAEICKKCGVTKFIWETAGMLCSQKK